jgi:hypothetical protein
MITPVVVVTWLAGGAVSAFGGWLFHKVFKLQRRVDALETKKK